MNENELFDKIELYLKKELNPTEMIAFDEEILNNPDLAETVKMHQFEWDAMEVLIEKDLRAKMSAWNNSLANTPSVSDEKTTILSLKKTAKTVRLYWIAAIAASVTLLIAAAFWFYQKPQNVVPEITQTAPIPKMDTPSVILPQKQEMPAKVVENVNKQDKNDVKLPNKSILAPNETAENDASYTAYAEEAYQKNDVPSYEDLQSTRGNSAENSVLDEAGKAYDKKDFKTAISLLRNTAVTDENFMALEILAHAEFQAKNYKSALPVFQNLLKMSGKKSHDKSEWYLLLCYLTDFKNQKTAFKSLSEKILANKNHGFYNPTKALLNAIK